MKYKNAEAFINKIIDNPSWNRVDIEWEAVDEIKEVLDKEKPLKIVRNIPSIYGLQVPVPYCDWCRKKVIKGDNYCHNCGHKLDWSKENE